MTRLIAFVILPVAAIAAVVPRASAQQFTLVEATSLAMLGAAQIAPNTVTFSDGRKDELADPSNGLIRFEDWARVQPLEKRYLSLYPGYSEPTIDVTVNGIKKSTTIKLSMYILEARFVLPKPAAEIDLSKYVSMPFLEKIDGAIKHRAIATSDVVPANNPKFAFNRNPARAWCAGERKSLCIESRYQLEGKLPSAIHLANILLPGKKHADYLEFQSELSVVPQSEINQNELEELTRLDAPVAGVLEQNIFYVNQVMEFGKFLTVLQQHPADTNMTIATAYLALAIKTRVLDRKKEFERVPVLRNLVPSQVLMGNSSFNTGDSLSAGLPKYSRNQIAAVASILAQN